MKRILSAFLAISLCFSGVPASAIVVNPGLHAANSGGFHLPYLVALRGRLTTAKSLTTFLGSLHAQFLKLPDGPDKQSLSLVLKAVASSPAQAAALAAQLDAQSARALAEVAVPFWGAAQTNAKLADKIAKVRAALAIGPVQDLGGSKAFAQLEKVIRSWDKDSEKAAVDAWLAAVSTDGGEKKPAVALKKAAPHGSAVDPYTRPEDAKEARVVSVNEDWDDNIVYLPTKIVLYEKKSGKELPVTTREFAKIKLQIGKPGAYEGYEFRSDSFRNFSGSPLEDLKWAIENLPKAEWQGPSWDAFVFALSKPETARWWTLITARRSSPEHVMETLRYLQEKGFIQHLPPVENIFAVGSTENPAAAKLEVMKKMLDRAQAVALGENAPLVLSLSGKRRIPLHLWGFSDDDYENYETARKGLVEAAAKSKEYPEGRWPSVKIVLYFTGKDGPIEPGAVVVTRDGIDRPLTTDEYGEGYVQALNDPEKTKKTKKATTLPYPTVARSPMKTVDDAIAKMWVSHHYETDNPKVVAGIDLVAVERGELAAFIDDDSVPASRKRVVLTRYSISDPDLAKVLVRAMKKDIPVTLITDFNTSMDFAFKEGMEKIVDFAKAKVKDDPAGRFLQALLDAGYKINDPKAKWRIYSQPLYNKGDASMDPIMHEKSVLLVTEGDGKAERKIDFYFGTNNLANNPRYNRLFKLIEPLIAAHALQHSEEIVEAFQAGKTIADIESFPPFRVVFEDGSFYELAFTNGKYNPNERFVRLFQRAKDDPENYLMEWLVFSEFVLTYGDFVDGLKGTREKQPRYPIQGVVEDKFAPMVGWGKVAAIAGLPTFPEFGASSFGWPAKLRENIELWVAQLGAKGVVEKELEGPPLAREVWHDKTAVAMILEWGRRWAYMKTGSLNNSNHVDNAELQILFRFPEGSPWPEEVRKSIVEVGKRVAVEFLTGLFRHTMARAFGKSPIEITVESVKLIEAAVKAKDWEKMKAELLRVAEAPTTLVKDVIKPEAARENVLRFMKFVAWYDGAVASDGDKMSALSIRRLTAALVPLAYPKLRPWYSRTALNTVLWSQKLDGPELEARIADAWKSLGLDGAPPKKEKKD